MECVGESQKPRSVVPVDWIPLRTVASNASSVSVEIGNRSGFLDVDVRRPLASVSAIVDEGNVVVFGQQDSDIENRSTGQSIPMSRRKGVFVVQLNAQAYKNGETEHEFGFQAASANTKTEDIRECCKTKS